MPAPTNDSSFEAEKPLSYYVDASLKRYFKNLNGCQPNELYSLIISEVEKPLLERVMHHCQGNNSRAAEILGINRATLRKKIQHYQITN
ncbi:MAG: DNA-binding transcriptional regulator Fis [Oceanococcus sp.]